MIFYSFFKTLVGKEVAVELKNDVVMTGILQSVDQYLNIKLSNVSVVNPERYPQLVSDDIARAEFLYCFSHCALVICYCQVAIKNCFVRGSVVR